MGFLSNLFGGKKPKIREDGIQQLNAILNKNIISFNERALWVAGTSSNPKDANAVYVMVPSESFCYIHRITAQNGVLSLSDAFVSSQNMLLGFDFGEIGNTLSIHANTTRGLVDFAVDPVINIVIGDVKIEKNQSREHSALKSVILPNYRAMYQTRQSGQGQMYDEINKLAPAIRQQIKGYLSSGEKIKAIKVFRDETGLGLAVAKDMVEHQDFYNLL